MQNDLISRSALKNALEYWTHFPTHRGGKSVYDIIDEAPSVDAVQVEKLGKFGKLMMPYEGCSRGHVGRMGLPATLENEALSFGIITDVDGGRWVPVVEDVLHELIAKAKANDPESLRPKGRWVVDGSGVVICSECGAEHEWLDYRASFCEDCGAKMGE